MEEDGGYYAIKGFMYQYDKTIIELCNLAPKNALISIEQIQDINFEEYVLQVKNKEKQCFTNSKIKEPVLKLIDEFQKDQTKKYILYAYFNDREPQKYVISNVDELLEIINYRDEEKNRNIKEKYSNELLERFIKNFTIQFSENYYGQFEECIKLIMKRFSKTKEEAFIIHAMIREYIINVCIDKESKDRNVTFLEVDAYIKNCKRLILENSYEAYLGQKAYDKLLKDEIFKCKNANLNNFNRLFILEGNNYKNYIDIINLIKSISQKYYRKGKSPAPYIIFKDLSKEVLISVKQELLDEEFDFLDGTCFDGDRFRINKIKQENTKVKICNIDNYEELYSNIKFKEIYNFYEKEQFINDKKIKIINIQIVDFNRINNILS